VTLTYSEENLPESVSKQEFQYWLVRLRKKLYPRTIRYFGCGEYGERSGRPHYHAVLFGIGLWALDIIQESWKKGFVSVAELNACRARYVARYTTKKLGSVQSFTDSRNPEFGLMSRKPGLGHDALPTIAASLRAAGATFGMYHGPENVQNQSNLGFSGFVRMNGQRYPLDTYMARKLKDLVDNPPTTDATQARRSEINSRHPPESIEDVSVERLANESRLEKNERMVNKRALI